MKNTHTIQIKCLFSNSCSPITRHQDSRILIHIRVPFVWVFFKLNKKYIDFEKKSHLGVDFFQKMCIIIYKIYSFGGKKNVTSI